MISVALSLTLCACCIPAVFADNEEKVRIVYSAAPDEKYGAPEAINPAEAQEVTVGEEFILADPLKTDSILAVDPLTDDIYIGQWLFSDWTVPDFVCTREVDIDTKDLYGEEYSALISVVEKQIFCTSIYNAEITGSWTFIPQEKLQIPDSIGSADALPLSGNYDSLSTFWPEREEALNRVYSTGLFPESIIRYMNENIRDVPLQDSKFSSVALTETERAGFLNAVRACCEAMTSDDGNAYAIENAIEDIMIITDSENISADTAFVSYCAELAGLLDGKSKSMIQTADLSALYSFLKNDACADFVTTDDLLQIYRSEDGETAAEIQFDDNSVNFAHEAGWYDVSNSKNTVQPGDLIVFKDELDNPTSVGVIGTVEGREITYIQYVGDGVLAEYSLLETDFLEMSRTGRGAVIIGLRSCDNSRIVYEFLVNELELPESSALSIMGNIYYESKFSTTALGDENTSFGLCQWHNDRFLNLVIFCIKNNYNIASLEGQLRFLAHELTENYSSLLIELRQCGISSSWTREAAKRFCQVFERPADVALSAALRGNVAAGALWESYSELFLTQTQLQNLKLAEMSVKPVAEQQSEYVTYTVKNGDTLWSICESLGFDYSSYRREIIKLNDLKNENWIYEGQTLNFLRSMVPNN